VTNENKAEFVGEKSGWNKEPAEAVVEKTPTEPQATDSDFASATEESKTAEDSERKPNPKIERRFSEITKQREAAKQEAERERQARVELETD
jgi:pyruvate/2-oxoacid:ferredoxin oxidoreductase beta subunit